MTNLLAQAHLGGAVSVVAVSRLSKDAAKSVEGERKPIAT